jgi:peptide/nickel transport system substrate-binding protein
MGSLPSWCRRAASINLSGPRGLAVATAAVLATGALGCSSDSGSSGSKTLRVGMTDEVSTVNPFSANTVAEGKSMQDIYPYLVNFSPKGEAVGSFAKSWDIAPDGRTVTFHTVPNAKWSDGEPLTAADVAFTINLVIKYKAGPTALVASAIPQVTGAEAPDANTVILSFSAPTATAVSDASATPILAEHVWSKHIGDKGAGLLQFSNVEPNVSGGPYVIARLTPKQSVRFVANANWFGRKPKNKGFTALTYRNPDALISAIKTSQVDLVDRPPLTSFNLLENAAGIETTKVPGFEKVVAQVNTNPKKLHHRSLLDPKVRKALSLAMDRDVIAEDVYHGAFNADGSVIGPYSPYHVDLPGTLYDIAAANTLLDDAGYKKGGDGIRKDADGDSLSFEVIGLSTTPTTGRVFDMMRENTKKIGIELKLKSLDPSAAFTYQASPDDKYLNYDMLLNTTSNGFDPNPTLLSMTCIGLESFNPTRYCNPKVDALVKRQATTLDSAERKDLIAQAQRLLYEEGPEIVIGFADGTSVYRDNWTGFETLADGAWSSLSPEGLVGAQPAG